MEFASSLKCLGWFVQILFDKCLTATLQDLDVIAEKPDLNEALESLLDELNSAQAMLSVAQNFGSQNKGLLEFLKNLKDAAYDADDLLSEVDYYRLEQQVNDSEDEALHGKVDYRLEKANTPSTPPSTDNNKATIVPRIHQIVSRLKRLVTCLRKALSLLQPEEGLRANPNVFPVASHPLTTSFLLSIEKRFLRFSYRGNHLNVLPEGEFLSMCNTYRDEDPSNHLELIATFSKNHLELIGIARQMAEGEFLSMFNKCAFGGEDPCNHLELIEIARQIAGKVKGSSLAAMTVAGLLREKLDEEHWKSVLCSDIWQQQKSPDDIMPILRLSYHHLPAHLQHCFVYCGVFPKNQKFKKEDLVGMWISQGYIHTKSHGNMSPEKIGSLYFDILLSKFFIQVSNEYMTQVSNEYMTYVLHPLLHDLAESVSDDEFLRINSNGTTKFTSRVRHIYVHANNLSLLKYCNLRNLRTLIIDGSIGYHNRVLEEVLFWLNSIRVLCLQTASVQLLAGSIRQLIHLRYLSVRDIYQNMQPDSQFRPYHLQWLIFELDSKCPIAFGLPTTINCLVSLRHLKARKLNMHGIGKLTHLQELESFSVGKHKWPKLGELKRLNELGGTLKLLSIQCASTNKEALEANLYKKIGIRKLELRCSGGGHASPQMAEEVFEGLRPPPYIEYLTLRGYNGVKSPSWMVTENHCLSYLQYLTLEYCRSWKVLPTLGELPLLRHLRIVGAVSVEEIGSSFYGSVAAKAFPCLEELEINQMPELVVWWSAFELKDTSGPVVSSGLETCPFFPCLWKLTLIDCPRLERVPIQHMTSVEVIETDCLLLLKELENLRSLQELFIHLCTELESVPLLPKTLESLQISSLEMLTAFSMEQEGNLSDLTSLRQVYIYDCPNLHSLPIMPASLQRLSIDDCPELPRERYREGGEDWHKISHVPDIFWVEGEDDWVEREDEGEDDWDEREDD